MNLEDIITTRRSIRKFSDERIDKELLEKIISAGNYAPSHCNTQAWRFIVVDDTKIQNDIFEFGGPEIVKNAPAGILVLYNNALSDNLEYQDWIQSASAAIQNMLLTIHSLGLGGCWICHLPPKKTLSMIFNIQRPYSPVAYIILGYPRQKTVDIPRKHDIKEIYSMNRYIWPEEKTSPTIHLKRIGRKTYFYLPAFVKKIIQPLVNKLTRKFEN